MVFVGHKYKNEHYRSPSVYPSGFEMIDLTIILGANFLNRYHFMYNNNLVNHGVVTSNVSMNNL